MTVPENSLNNLENIKLEEEYSHGSFLVRYHTHDSSGNKHHIVCINPRDGHLDQEINGVKLATKLVRFIKEEDIVKAYGQKVYRPVNIGACLVGFNEQVVSFKTLNPERVPMIKKLGEDLINRYEQS